MAACTGYWRQAKPVLYALLLMEGILGTAVPKELKGHFGVQRLNALERYLIRLKIRGFNSSLICPLLWLCDIPGLARKLQFGVETVFPRREIMEQIRRDRYWKPGRKEYLQRIRQSVQALVRDAGRARHYTRPWKR